jgi:hypothetical protein
MAWPPTLPEPQGWHTFLDRFTIDYSVSLIRATIVALLCWLAGGSGPDALLALLHRPASPLHYIQAALTTNAFRDPLFLQSLTIVNTFMTIGNILSFFHI